MVLFIMCRHDLGQHILPPPAHISVVASTVILPNKLSVIKEQEDHSA